MFISPRPSIAALACAVGIWGLGIWAGAAGAFTLDLPKGSTVTAERTTAEAEYALAMGPFADGAVPTRIAKGVVTQTAYRLVENTITPERLMDLIAPQLIQAGLVPLYSCTAQTCGGYDFRFGVDLMRAPDMFIDLGDYAYLSAQSDTQSVMVLTSRSSNAAYIQVTRIGETGGIKVTATTKTAPQAAIPRDPGDMIAALEDKGHFILADIAFETGSSSISTPDAESLGQVAGWLEANPEQTIALVGHTDSVGSLEGNTNLSRARANAVRNTLISRYGTDPARVEADGVGYLSPIANNRTGEGRNRNRRVEVIVTTTE